MKKMEKKQLYRIKCRDNNDIEKCYAHDMFICARTGSLIFVIDNEISFARKSSVWEYVEKVDDNNPITLFNPKFVKAKETPNLYKYVVDLYGGDLEIIFAHDMYVCEKTNRLTFTTYDKISAIFKFNKWASVIRLSDDNIKE